MIASLGWKRRKFQCLYTCACVRVRVCVCVCVLYRKNCGVHQQERCRRKQLFRVLSATLSVQRFLAWPFFGGFLLPHLFLWTNEMLWLDLDLDC